MKISRIARISAIGAVAALALTGCAANETTSPGASDQPAGGTELTGNLVGGGATSQEVAIAAWTKSFQTANSGVTVDYDPQGSGAGRESFAAGGFAFAGSDRAFKTDELSSMQFTGCAPDSPIIEIPAYISPIAVIFNLEGVDSLNLDADTLAGIFAGTITNWNDPKIAASNEGVELPDLAINPVHRADKSGTTGNFTDYLSAAAGSVWTHGSVEEWPIGSGEAAQGTSGLVQAVEGGKGTIGYADASRAGDLGTVSVKVGDEFVAYSPEAAAAIVDHSPLEEREGEGDLAVELDRTSSEAGVYPIVLVSYLIGCEEYADAAQAALVKGFFTEAISAEGQKAAAEAAGSAPISDTIRAKAEAAIDLIVTK
ncbi:phosphate ABC transporter substrate-binding protein PstS [Microbacterium sp. ARD32]|uniref:phosphate ABC transporter substrate-binding protein PstS n=1 Tax=Microbacterium sp. ARD32 TaxID=2962577 RepID=UPI002881C286|nr:phosphate ABC transporter substrate-binding protein PstS [Microbacterium sp. ARD32]MDT0158497.1 phosphate ABC transporter substrate-binding protein PstS [Microbacterium sp. ARD32]